MEAGNNPKTAGIQRTLDNVTGKMRNNLNKMFENENELNSMDQRSGEIRNTAEQF